MARGEEVEDDHHVGLEQCIPDSTQVPHQFGVVWAQEESESEDTSNPNRRSRYQILERFIY